MQMSWIEIRRRINEKAERARKKPMLDKMLILTEMESTSLLLSTCRAKVRASMNNRNTEITDAAK